MKLKPLLWITLLSLALASCGGPREYTPASLDDDICKTIQRNARIQVSGVLKLPGVVLVVQKQTRVLMVKDLSQDQPWLGLLIRHGTGNNRMEPLSEDYRRADFVVKADDGREIGHGTPVTIYGRMEDTANCNLAVERIE